MYPDAGQKNERKSKAETGTERSQCLKFNKIQMKKDIILAGVGGQGIFDHCRYHRNGSLVGRIAIETGRSSRHEPAGR